MKVSNLKPLMYIIWPTPRFLKLNSSLKYKCYTNRIGLTSTSLLRM